MDNKFEHTSAEQWRARIEKELKSTAYETLCWSLADGVVAKPDYTAADAPPPFLSIPTRSRAEAWLVWETINIDTFDAANKSARERLMMGVNALAFRGGIRRMEDLETLLREIDIPYIHVFFDESVQPTALLEHYLAHVKRQGYALEKVAGGMAFDPIGSLAGRGNWTNNEIRDRETAGGLVNFCISHNLRQFRPLLVDASVYHNAGADTVWELACALGHANEYLQWMRQEDIDARKGFRHLHFRFGAGRKYYAHIAKFRAFRTLWANVCKAYEIEPSEAATAFVVGETSWRERSPQDPQTNLIRTTSQAMSAAIGGCDAVSVVPFDAGTPSPADSSIRLARNVSLILQEEAHLSEVTDPAAGAYLFESLTADIMERAWSVFKEIESRGGFIENLKTGWIQNKIAEQAAAEDKRIASGASVYIGLNKYTTGAETASPEAPATPMPALESKQVEPLLPRPAQAALAKPTQPKTT